MKGDTPLDYAEFQLSPKRTRCELLISADGFMEKLASGFLKPFVTHLRAAEVQVARGNHAIRLETQGGSHHQQQQIENAWFCKGTLERFVRFVSTPEVIERVKTIEDELTQLEQVHSALVHTFTQTPERFAYSSESGLGSQQKRGPTCEEDNGADPSKSELLRAMEARLTALHQEQQMAFSRATAAGFDNNNIADLMTFAEHFGAARLKDACTQFLTLSKKRTMLRGGSKSDPQLEASSDGLVPSEEAWPHGPKRRLDFGAVKLQNHSDGPGAPFTTRDPKKEGSAGGTFFERLHQMAQQVDGRSGEDFGWQMDNETNDQWPPQGNSAMWRELTTDESVNSTHKNGDSSSLQERSSPLPPLRVDMEVPCIGNSSPTQSAKAEDIRTMTNECRTIPVEMSGMKSDDSKSQSAPGEMPARRLSVQAAISLFESKKKDSTDPPFRKLVKQESRKMTTESATSPSEKSVLKRWSVASPHGQEENMVSDKKPVGSRSLERPLVPEVKAQDEVSTLSAHEASYGPTPGTQSSENFTKSLNEVLHLDSTERNARYKGLDAQMQQIKPFTPLVQQPADIIMGSNNNLESKNHTRQTNMKNEAHPTSTQEHADVASNAGAPPPVAPVPPPPIPKPLKNADKEPDWQPVTIESTDYSGKMEQEDKDKGWPKVHNTKGSQPKRSDLPSERPKAVSPVSSQMPVQSSEQENSRTISAAAPVKQEQTSGMKGDFVKLQEVPARSRKLAKSMNYGTTTVQTKESSPSNLLNTSVDLHMQALVKMVEHQYENFSLNSMDILEEPKGEQKGQFYDKYSKLRDAKMRREHPAKRAEREAKLKSMQETLERRKAELDSQGVRRSKKKALRVELGEKAEPRKSGLAVTMVEQKDLKDEEDGTDQEEPLRLSDQFLDHSNPTSPTSTSHAAKNRSLIKSRAPTKTLPPISKPSIAARNSFRATNSSPKASPKNLMAMPSQGKALSPGNTSSDGSAFKANFNLKDVAKTSLVRAAGSARVHPRSNTFSSDSAVPGDDGSPHGLTEKKEPRLMTRKAVASVPVSKSLPTEAGTVLGSTKDKQELATDLTVDGKGPQEAKPFLRKGQGIGPGAGPGVMKQKASIFVDASKSSDEETSTDSKEDGIALDCAECKVPIEDPESNGREDDNLVNEQDAAVVSSVPMAPNVDDESKSTNSRLSDTLDMEALDYLPENASDNDKTCHDTSSPVEEPEPQEVTAEDVNPETQGSFLQPLYRRKEKEGSQVLSEILAQRSHEAMQHDAGFVKSSISFREASRTHGQIGSPSPTSASHDYSSILQRGAVSSRFSPPRANPLDLPLGSPALWHASHGSKYMAEPSMIRSGRPLSGTQKHASALPLPPKEPSKGLKRLLHFGRKSRPSETTTDCVSVSTASEGDEDADEVKEFGSQASDELLRKIRMQKKWFDYGNLGDHYSSPDQAQYSGSSIPPPPANFKLREEHLSGGNLIKAPSRSFFSLSSFRSKGSEGKSR